MIFKDIAQYEDTDSDLAKRTITDLYFQKEQLKADYKRRLEGANHILELQGQKGNYDYDEYMLGLYNGMEYVIALMEQREFNPIDGHQVQFTHNKLNQLKQWLDSFHNYSEFEVWEIKNKIKELEGVKDE